VCVGFISGVGHFINLFYTMVSIKITIEKLIKTIVIDGIFELMVVTDGILVNCRYV